MSSHLVHSKLLYESLVSTVIQPMLYYFDIQNFYTLQKVQNHTVYLHHVTRATVTMVTFRQKIPCDLTGAGLNRFGHGVRFGIARTEGWKKLGFSKKGFFKKN